MPSLARMCAVGMHHRVLVLLVSSRVSPTGRHVLLDGVQFQPVRARLSAHSLMTRSATRVVVTAFTDPKVLQANEADDVDSRGDRVLAAIRHRVQIRELLARSRLA